MPPDEADSQRNTPRFSRRMPSHATNGGRPAWGNVVDAVVLLAVAGMLAWAVKGPLDSDTRDFSQFYVGARLLLDRESPYDTAQRTAVHRTLPVGETDLLPGVYPLWVYQAFVPLGLLNYDAASWLWVFVCGAATVGAARMLAKPVLGDAATAIAVGALFFPATLALFMGQLTPVLLLAAAMLCWALRTGRWTAAGVLLGLLASKPHIGLWIGFAVCLWAARNRHWKVPAAAGATVAALVVVGFAAIGDWPWQLIAQLRAFPVPTIANPRVGVTWANLAFAVTDSSVLRWAIIAAVSGPAVVLTAYSAGSVRDPARVVGVATASLFFVVPYAQLYDYVLLVIPLVLLSGGRWRVALAVLVVVLPYVQAYSLAESGLGLWKVTYFWLPALLAVLLFTSTGRYHAEIDRPTEGGRSPGDPGRTRVSAVRAHALADGVETVSRTLQQARRR